MERERRVFQSTIHGMESWNLVGFRQPPASGASLFAKGLIKGRSVGNTE